MGREPIPRHHSAGSAVRPTRIIRPACPQRLPNVVDQFQKPGAFPADPCECFFPDVLGGDPTGDQLGNGTPDRRGIGIADDAKLLVEVNVTSPATGSAHHPESRKHVFHRSVVRAFDFGKAESDMSAIQRPVGLHRTHAYRHSMLCRIQ